MPACRGNTEYCGDCQQALSILDADERFKDAPLEDLLYYWRDGGGASMPHYSGSRIIIKMMTAGIIRDESDHFHKQ